MNLILYSGGTGSENRPLAVAAADMLARHNDPIVTFLPAHAEDADAEYRAFVKTFQRLGINRFRCIPIDHKLTQKEEKEIFSSNAIFLGGGNTFHFLKQLQSHGFLEKLRLFAKKGGVLFGLSAGSILMTPTITTASVPSMDSDDNEVNLKDWKALGLVPFEFSPHYYPSKAADRELMEYSKKLEHPIYACSDGEGIVVRDGKIQFIGQVKVFHQGLKYTIH